MKKILLLILAFMVFKTSSMAQKEIFSGSLIGAYSHFQDPDLHCGTLGVYLSIYNVYFGFTFDPTNTANSVNVGKWGEEYVNSYHLGYRFPIHKRIGVIPLVGVTYGAIGTMDGDDWHIGETGIINNFIPTESRTTLDVGVMMDLSFPFGDYIDLGWKILIGATWHNAFIGLGLYF